VRLSDEGVTGVALSLDGNGRFARLDPAEGAKLALFEAARNVAAVGATPVAVSDCMNFGSPEDPEVMWQFAEAIRGLAQGCRDIGIPVTGGNVSFYNQTAAVPINPTPVVGVLGVIDDVTKRTPIGFREAGALIFLLGETREELDGSEWAWTMHRHLGGRPPVASAAAELALQKVLIDGSTGGWLHAAHDLSDGGLAQAVVESALRGGQGARLALDGDVFVQLFSESAARAIVAVLPEKVGALGAVATEAGISLQQIGAVGGDSVEVAGHFSVPLDELREAFEATLPRLFG